MKKFCILSIKRVRNLIKWHGSTPQENFQDDVGGPVKSLHDISHCQDVTWPISPIYDPRCMVFSWKGDIVGIATSYSEGAALIRILGENRGEWSHWG